MKWFKLFWNGGEKRKLEGVNKRIVSVIAISMSLYQIWQTVFSAIQPMLHYTIHLMFIVVMAYLMYTSSAGKDRKKITKIDWIFVVLMIFAGIYFSTQTTRYIARWPMFDPLFPMDIISSLIIVLFLVNATRRLMGMVLPTIGIIFTIYAMLGHLLPGLFAHRQRSPLDVLDQMMFTINGVFGSPIAVAATFVFLFCLFGAFFNQSGAGDFFYRFALAATGKYAGGAGKVSIFCSLLFGTISGSPTANVMATGTFTIPMMKKTGFSPVFAGGVEAVSSTGGALVPPIMGTAALLMVEMAGIPYLDVALAAAVPSILFFAAVGFMVHFRAMKMGLKGLDPATLPPLWPTLKSGFYYIFPLITLMVIILMGYTPSMAAVGGIVSIVIVSWFKKETRMGFKKIMKALEDGALQAIIITLACAVAGIVINGLVTTGLSGRVASLVLSIGGGNILLALILTAILCIIMGLGMPVAAAYSLTAALAVPSLLELGMPLMPAHMFIVYFATMSAITPPVAVASFAAAGIADASASKICFQACRLGVVAFIVPFMYVLQPIMLLTRQTFGVATILAILSALFGVLALSSGIEGWLIGKVKTVFQLPLVISGLLLMYPNPISNYIGLAVLVTVCVFQFLIKKKNRIISN